MASNDISAEYRFTIHRVKVDSEAEMTYIDTDPTQQDSQAHPPVVFLHGNPTYSYLWRNVIPHVAPIARCLAPDLIGFGASSKLPSDRYGFHDHVRYLDAFFEKVLSSSQPVVLVLHDFGSLFGFNWACRHADRVTGLVFMEFHPPMPRWKDTGAMGPEILKALSGSPDETRKALLERNVFIELFLPDQVVRPLSQREMLHYRAPFPDPSSRESLWEISKIFPVAGNPPDVYEAADPGKIISVEKSEWYTKNLKNSKSIAVGNAKHFIPEDNPDMVGKEIKEWLGACGKK